jgi:hypothetical protein
MCVETFFLHLNAMLCGEGERVSININKKKAGCAIQVIELRKTKQKFEGTPAVTG